MSRLKLTAGGSKYVSECLRYECRICKDTLLLHPNRWPVHVQECCKKLDLEYLIYLYKTESSTLLKQLFEKEVLLRHNGIEQ